MVRVRAREHCQSVLQELEVIDRYTFSRATYVLDLCRPPLRARLCREQVWPDLISREYITLQASDQHATPTTSSTPYDEI